MESTQVTDTAVDDSPGAIVRVINTNIKVGLARTGRSNADLAAVVGISPAALSRRLAARVPWDVIELARVAAYLGVDLRELLA